MNKKTEERTLTRAEMEIMAILWDNSRGMTTHEIIEHYPEPKPAYSTIATFMKILTNKGFVTHRKREDSGKTFFFYPSITRQEYTRKFMAGVKHTLFEGSLKSLISFFIEEEEISDEEMKDILAIMEGQKA